MYSSTETSHSKTMELKICISLCVCFCMRPIQAIDWKSFSELSISYYKARHVNYITVVNCFTAEANFQLMKTYMEAGFFVQIINNLDNFNGTSRGKSGVAVDGTCEEKIRKLLKLTTINEFMQTNIFWMFVEDSSISRRESKQGISDTYRSQYNERFRTLEVLPGSRVVVGVLQESVWNLFDVHKKHCKGPLQFNEICFRGRNLNILTNMQKALWRVDKNNKERRNLRGYSMPTGLTITSPETYKGATDISDTLHDHYVKASFPLIQGLMYDLNFTLDMTQVDQGGWKTNGTFNALMGLFQNRTIELAAMGNLMRSERMEVVDFTIVTLLVKTCIIFKQPPLSLVSNIFELPFSGEVWLSCLGFIFVCWITMFSFRFISSSAILTPADSLTFIIGTMCQQSIELFSYFDAPRFLFFTAKLASFFIFTAYSATIVALLQSPSRAINSVADLTESPLKVGAMENVYVWVYLSESKDPEVQKLFRKKIKPYGEKSLIEPNVGMRKVKEELYAFQVEANAAYRLIKETFTPQDTCKIHELEAIKVAPFAIPMKKGSKYRELFRQRLIWQLEVGLINRAHRMWVARKPNCEAGSTAFNSVGYQELRFLYALLAVGLTLAAFIVIVELAWKKWLRKGNVQRGSTTVGHYGGYLD